MLSACLDISEGKKQISRPQRERDAVYKRTSRWERRQREEYTAIWVRNLKKPLHVVEAR